MKTSFSPSASLFLRVSSDSFGHSLDFVYSSACNWAPLYYPTQNKCWINKLNNEYMMLDIFFKNMKRKEGRKEGERVEEEK